MNWPPSSDNYTVETVQDEEKTRLNNPHIAFNSLTNELNSVLRALLWTILFLFLHRLEECDSLEGPGQKQQERLVIVNHDRSDNRIERHNLLD